MDDIAKLIETIELHGYIGAYGRLNGSPEWQALKKYLLQPVLKISKPAQKKKAVKK